ncbi:MAG TPA: PEGA domain-containing protein, partial [Kofleriaceae bacterium]|nr:PEGA domain-containing protein [Kofleriaceae bacterium]
PIVLPAAFEPTQPALPTYVPVAGPDQPTGFSLPVMATYPQQGPGPLPEQPAPFQQQQPGPLAHHSGPHVLQPPAGAPMAPLHHSAPHELPPAYAHLSAQFPMSAGQMVDPMTGQHQLTGQHPGGLASGSYPPAHYSGGYPMMAPGAFPQGNAGATMTGRMRALEIDEIPAHYRIRREGPRWFVLLAIALTAVAAAATVTFLVLRANRQDAVASAALRIESFPAAAAVYVDDQKLPDPTPVIFKNVVPGGRYKVRIELPHHVSYAGEVVIGTRGGEVVLNPTLRQLTGTLRITSTPPGAEITINGEPRGRTPLTLRDQDLNTKQLELRLAKYDPFRQQITWDDKTELTIDATLTPAGQKPR